jgi:hypothetical protein
MRKEINVTDLLGILDQQLQNLPDVRKKSNNQKYEVKDGVNAAFSVFFTQSSSFLEHQRIMRSKKGSVTLLGDDLYSHEPIINLAREQGYNFIFVALPSSHQNLYDWLEYLERNDEVKTLEKKRWDGRKTLIYQYRYANKVPLVDRDDSILVNWCEVKVIEQETQEVVYQNNWITDHQITDNNVSEIVEAGRSRWKIENEGNNILKNHGYHLEHNFGHGQNHLCEFLLSLNLLAFLFHTILDLVNSIYQQIRALLKTRKSFFNDLRTLLRYCWFDSWESLWIFILTEGDTYKNVNST